jgi:hypothetical protein
MKPQVNHRFETLKAGENPANDLENSLVEILRTGKTSNADVQYAYDIYVDEYKREVLEAFLLASATDKDIFDVIKIPESVSAVYRPIFFDQSVFRDELDRECYAQTYPKKPSSWGHDLKICALTLGLDYMRYRFSRGPITVDITGALNEMIATASFLSKAGRINPMDSTATKQSLNWMAAAVKTMEAYVKVKPATEARKDEFELVLKTIDESTEEEQPKIDITDLVH